MKLRILIRMGTHIGKGALIGIRAIINKNTFKGGAKIGKGALIGIRALINKNTFKGGANIRKGALIGRRVLIRIISKISRLKHPFFHLIKKGH